MSILGNRVLRKEDPALLRGEGQYVDAIPIPGAAHATFVRSTMAHARIDAIDVSEAQRAPGVLTVVTADDLDLADVPGSGRAREAMARPLLARDTVRFVGEPVAVVISESPAQGEDAAESVVIDYDPLDAVIGVQASLDGSVLLFPEAGSNVAMTLDPEESVAFDDCDVVVAQTMVNQRVAPSPIEPRVAAALWEDDRLVVHVSCQGAHPVRDELARVYDLDPDRIRVITRDVGGSFGAKATNYPETLLLGWLAARVGRPVRWYETRTENMTAMGHGRGQRQEVTLGGTRDGRITAYRLDVDQDAGAYPAMGAVLPFMTRTMLTGVYDIRRAEFSSRSVATNTVPTVAYRGAGRPEATAAIERAVDLFAAEIGMDPAEVRRRNLIAPEAFPYETVVGTTYDSGDYAVALDRALDAVGYRLLRQEQQRRRDDDDPNLLGIGMATYVEITAFGGGPEHGSVEVRPDGHAVVTTGSSPYGQGHHTAWAMLASEQLGIPIDDIEVVHGDTDRVPSGSITGGSRSVQIAGAAVHDAAQKVVALARERAADHLEAAADDLVLDRVDGVFHVAGTPAINVGWAELAATEPLAAVSDFSADGATFPFGAHVAVVEIDRETGLVVLRRIVAVDDAGVILNPLLADGQVHGGLAQGVAQALYEEARYDEWGNPTTSNFADYTVVSATELPMFERIPMETPTPLNDLGAKGIGESGTVGSTPAVWNAVIDGLSHLGVRHLDMPCTPERVWRAIQAATP